MNLPIAERELRVAARSRRTYRGRFVSALVFGAMTGWLLWALTYLKLQPAMIAPQVFTVITFAAMMSCIFSINQIADSISSEKRDGTLGLLFLTDLKGRDVVAGKLAAFGVTTFYALMGAIPMISIPVLLGGIKGETIFKIGLSLLNTLFFSTAIGLWVSSKSWDQKRAMNAAVWMALLFAWGLPGLSALLIAKYKLVVVAGVLAVFSPMYQLTHANPFGLGMYQDFYWVSLGCVHGMAWLALWRACRILPHAWQDRPAEKVKPWKERLRQFSAGTGEARRSYRTRLLERNPLHWLTATNMRAHWWVWFFIAMVMLGWVGMWAWFKYGLKGGAEVTFWGVGVPAVMIMQLGLWMRTAAVASDVLARDRFNGALELLLSTSITVEEVTRGVAMTVRKHVVGPAIFAFAASAIVFWLGAHDGASDEDMVGGWVSFIGLNVLFVAQLFASFWGGLWGACYTRLASAAAGQVMVRLLVLPWTAFFLVVTMGAILQIKDVDSFTSMFVVWFILNFDNAFFWAVRSHDKFYANLRLAASERYQPAAPEESWWKFWRWKMQRG